jgi:ribosomal protein L37E
VTLGAEANMAEVACRRCGLTAFSVAYWSNTDHCPRCGTELPRPTGITARIRAGSGRWDGSRRDEAESAPLPAGMIDSVRAVMRERAAP